MQMRLINILLMPAVFFFSLPCIGYDTLISVTGSVYGNTCTISTTSQNIEVSLGMIGISQFKNGRKSNIYTPFSIKLEDCGPEFSGVKIIFDGVPDANFPDYLQLDSASASGIALALLDKNKNIIPLKAESEIFGNQVNKTIELSFFAHMVANGKKVNPGNVSAYATWTLQYQ